MCQLTGGRPRRTREGGHLVEGTRLRLHAVQAAFGDCLLVEAGSRDQSHVLLIDGGPTETYRAYLRPLLVRLAERGRHVEIAALSHIDNDHVRGLLALFDDLGPGGESDGLPRVDQLWHNSFSNALGSAELAPLVREAVADAGRAIGSMPALTRVLRGFEEGDALRTAAGRAGMPINPGFEGGEVLVGSAPTVTLGGATVTVVGPSRGILDDLRDEWIAWLARHRGGIRRDVAGAIAADRSVPNLSSICLLVGSGDRSILLTGDARGEQVLAGLRAAGLVDADGRRRVSVLKVPHHGSARNIDHEFLRAVPADMYVISADGRYGNPDYDALVMIVEAAHADGRPIRLVMTNPTESVERLLASHEEESYGYELRILRRGRSSLTVEAGPPRS